MGEFKAPAKLTRYHDIRVKIGDEVWEVRSNVSAEEMAARGYSLAWLVGLARRYGHPVRVEAAS
jgi:hypothetical protein